MALCLLVGSDGTRPPRQESRACVPASLCSGVLFCVCVQHPGGAGVNQGSVQVWGLGNQGQVPVLPFWLPGAEVSLATLRCSSICTRIRPRKDNSARSVSSSAGSQAYGEAQEETHFQIWED